LHKKQAMTLWAIVHLCGVYIPFMLRVESNDSEHTKNDAGYNIYDPWRKWVLVAVRRGGRGGLMALA
jgi:hypothetical protein